MNYSWNALKAEKIVEGALDAMGLVRKTEASGFGSFLFGCGVGLVAGGAVALLLTPFNGTEAREKLVTASGDISKTLTEKVSGIKTNLVQQFGQKGDISPELGYGTTSGSRIGV